MTAVLMTLRCWRLEINCLVDQTPVTLHGSVYLFHRRGNLLVLLFGNNQNRGQPPLPSPCVWACPAAVSFMCFMLGVFGMLVFRVGRRRASVASMPSFFRFEKRVVDFQRPSFPASLIETFKLTKPARSLGLPV